MTGITYTDGAGFVHEVVDPFVALVIEDRRQRERDAKRLADRAWAAMALAPSIVIAQALYRGRRVPHEVLEPRFRDQLVCWDGVLTDELVLDVLVLVEAYRLAGDLETPPSAPWMRKRAA
jgi:hypothetical protein